MTTVAVKLADAKQARSNWSTRTLADLATTVASGRSSTGRAYGTYPVYGSTGVIGYCEEPEYAGAAVLVARVGANAGKLNLISGRYGVTDNAIILRLTDKAHLPFFWRQLEYKDLNRLVFGSGQPLLTGTQLKQLRVPEPSIDEQKLIAGVLDDVDGYLKRIALLIAKKRDLKQAAMQQLLTGKTRLPSFDGPWQTAGLGTLFVFSGGFSASREQLSKSGHPYLHYGDIHLSTKPYVDVSAEGDQLPRLDVDLREVGQASLLRDGDVVFVDASEDDEGASKHIVIDNAGNLPYISGLHTIVAKSRGDHLDKLFKRYCFQSRRVKEQFKFYAVGTKVSGISKSNIAKIELTFPTSSEEQRSIATALTVMDTELAHLMEQRDKLLALKQGMMQQLLTGRIRLL